MQPLTIEYVLEGPRPGYTYVGSTDGFADETLTAIWRGAMPRGQGWGADRYTDARAIKCFAISGGRVAISAVRVTGMQDELGRGGIRRADITVIGADAYHSFVAASISGYPPAVRQAARERVGSVAWRRVVNKALLQARQQIVLAAPYNDAAAWQLVEALVMQLVLSQGVRLMEGWGRTPSFTTLALNWRDEARIVALPLDVARRVQGVPVIVVD